MKFELKNYQETAVNKLLQVSKTFLNIGWEQELVFKAPTWSGKTIMMASFLERFKDEDLWDFAFVWISVNKLHTQSKKSLENTIWVWAFNFYNLENVREKLNKNDILFFNWQSVTKKARSDNTEKWIEKWDYTNIFMSDNETNRNLPNFIENTLDEWRKIILIIDESHLHLTEDTEKLIQKVIKPTLRIEVSATPNKKETVSVELWEVIKSWMIKEEVVINEWFWDLNLLKNTGEEIIIKQWLEKRENLKSLYTNWINPLVLIQIPWNTAKTSILEKSEIEKVEKILKEQYNITRDNWKLAVYLSEDKTDNLEDISSKESTVEVLIFKQAIATGWDCPRAQILIMFREIKSITFEIQTVWRIMRMPELKHYENEELNKAYVYTNFWEINISDWEASKYIKVKQSKIKSKYENIVLPDSVYLKRLDYNDLYPTEEFHKLFYTTFLNEIWWKESELYTSLYDKLNDKINLNKEFKSSILLETKLKWIDWIWDYKVWETKTDEQIIEYQFKKILDTYLTWLNKARSNWVLKQSFYNFFNHYLWFKDKSALEIQKIILTNSDFFEYIVKQTIKEFENIRLKKIEQKQGKSIYDWSIIENEMFTDSHIKKDNYKKCIQSPCYFKEDSRLEKEFVEEYLEINNDIEFWYKNWVSNKIYFWILYIYEWKQSVFYPDFIVKYKDWKIGIFDTKAWMTASEMKTKFKAESLQEYCENKDNIFWWIVIKNWNSFYLNSWERYDYVNDNLAGWGRM